MLLCCWRHAHRAHLYTHGSPGTHVQGRLTHDTVEMRPSADESRRVLVDECMCVCVGVCGWGGLLSARISQQHTGATHATALSFRKIIHGVIWSNRKGLHSRRHKHTLATRNARPYIHGSTRQMSRSWNRVKCLGTAPSCPGRDFATPRSPGAAAGGWRHAALWRPPLAAGWGR